MRGIGCCRMGAIIKLESPGLPHQPHPSLQIRSPRFPPFPMRPGNGAGNGGFRFGNARETGYPPFRLPETGNGAPGGGSGPPGISASPLEVRSHEGLGCLRPSAGWGTVRSGQVYYSDEVARLAVAATVASPNPSFGRNQTPGPRPAGGPDKSWGLPLSASAPIGPKAQAPYNGGPCTLSGWARSGALVQSFGSSAHRDRHSLQRRRPGRM